MSRPQVARALVRLVPVALLMVSFGRQVTRPSDLLVDADRPTIDRARVVSATPGNDLTRQSLPLHLHIARTLARTGRIPQWDDRGFGGRPLVGNPQAGLFYPPVWLAWFFPYPATLGWITVIHLVWASQGMGQLARTLAMSESSRMAASGCFVLSPYVLAQTFEGHYPHVWAASWYPWAFTAMIQIGRGSWVSGLRLAAILAAVFLAGHPQEGYYLVIALGIRGLADLARLLRGSDPRRRFAPTLLLWAGVGLLTLGLVAVEFVPDAMAQSWGLRLARMPLRLASRYHPSPINALQLFNPFALGGPSEYFGPENYWETVLSIGLTPLILAGVGATWTLDRSQVRGWIILVLAATMFASGRKLGLFALMYELVPGMDRFRVPSRALFLANLGAAVLVGFGVEALGGDRGADRRRWLRLGSRWALAVAILAGMIGWGCWRTDRARLMPASFGSSAVVEEARSRSIASLEWDRCALGFAELAKQPAFWLAVGGISGGLLLGGLRPRRRRVIAAGLGLLGLVELAGSGYQLLVTSSPTSFLEPGTVGEAIRQACPDDPGRPLLRVRADDAIVPDLLAVQLGLSKTDINDAFQIQHAADLYGRLYDLSRPKPILRLHAMDGPSAERIREVQQAVLDRMGVALILADRTTPRVEALIEANEWPVLASIPGRNGRNSPVTLARNPSVLPRAYMVPRAEVVATEGVRDVDRLAEVDPKRTVLMTRDPLGHVPASAPRQPFRPVEWISSDPDRLVVKVTTEAPGLLVMAETWMPGWTARVDGRDARVERGDHAQRVVALPVAGRHEVELTYEAPGFRLGLTISTISAVVWWIPWVVMKCRGGPLGKASSVEPAIT